MAISVMKRTESSFFELASPNQFSCFPIPPEEGGRSRLCKVLTVNKVLRALLEISATTIKV